MREVGKVKWIASVKQEEGIKGLWMDEGGRGKWTSNIKEEDNRGRKVCERRAKEGTDG